MFSRMNYNYEANYSLSNGPIYDKEVIRNYLNQPYRDDRKISLVVTNAETISGDSLSLLAPGEAVSISSIVALAPLKMFSFHLVSLGFVSVTENSNIPTTYYLKELDSDLISENVVFPFSANRPEGSFSLEHKGYVVPKNSFKVSNVLDSFSELEVTHKTPLLSHSKSFPSLYLVDELILSDSSLGLEDVTYRLYREEDMEKMIFDCLVNESFQSLEEDSSDFSMDEIKIIHDKVQELAINPTEREFFLNKVENKLKMNTLIEVRRFSPVAEAIVGDLANVIDSQDHSMLEKIENNFFLFKDQIDSVLDSAAANMTSDSPSFRVSNLAYGNLLPRVS